MRQENISVGQEKKSVYLAGPINGCSDNEVFEWRKSATEMLAEFTVKNPADRDYRGREMEPGVAEEIVRGDMEDIAACDYMIAYCPKPSVGTSMEVCLYFTQGMGRVVVVVPQGNPSPWLLYHSHGFCRSLEEACDLVRKWSGDRRPELEKNDPIGWTIIDRGNNGTILCQNHRHS